MEPEPGTSFGKAETKVTHELAHQKQMFHLEREIVKKLDKSKVTHTDSISTSWKDTESDSCSNLFVPKQLNSRLKQILVHSGKESSPSEENELVYSLNLLTLPKEILESILKYLSYSELTKLRLVCHAFNGSIQGLINKRFHQLQQQMMTRFHAIKSKMPRRESLRRKHPLARESDIIETIHMRLTLLQMTFGKHIERKHCCFFPGEILDEIYRILHYIKTTPNLGRAYKVTDELFDLSSMAMEYFKEHVEPVLPEINYFATEFPDLAATLASPATKPLLWQVKDSPRSGIRKSTIAEKSPQPGTPSSGHDRFNRVKQKLKTCIADVNVLKRELKSCKNKMAHQQKQLIEANSKLEQHERKFDEQNKKFDALMREFKRCKDEMRSVKVRHGRDKGRPPSSSTVGNVNASSSTVGNVNASVIEEDIQEPPPKKKYIEKLAGVY